MRRLCEGSQKAEKVALAGSQDSEEDSAEDRNTFIEPHV